MPFFKFLIIFIILFITSCSESVQNNGLTITKINQIKIEIGKTSKDELSNKYGPPIFESIFNYGVIYYVSHKSSYLNFNPRTTKNLVVLEITFDNKNIVKNIKKYSENDAVRIDVSKETTNDTDNKGVFLKQIFDNVRKKNLKN